MSNFYDQGAPPSKPAPRPAQQNVGNPAAQGDTNAEDKMLTYGVFWAHFSTKFGEIPFFSGVITVNDLPAPNENGEITFMAFPNMNRREGKHDPQYYMVPSRDK